MADASVSIGGDASGAIAACAAAQGAIDALHGKTVRVDIETRGGGAGGMAGATRDMENFGRAADRAGRSTRGMGDDLGRSGGHMSKMARDAESLRRNMERAGRSGGMGGSDGARQAEALRRMGIEAAAARQSIGAIGAESSRSMGAIESGASRAGGGMRELGSGAESASRFMAGTSGAAQRVSKDLVPMAQGADGVYRSVSRMAGASGDVEKFAGSMRTIDAIGRTIDGGGGGGPGGGGLGGLIGKLGELPSVAMPSARALMGVGLAAGVSTLGMGALSAAVAGVGLGGVAEDFMHNSQLMHAGEQDLRAFNREFTAMKGATSAAAGPEMGGLKSSIKGVGHELAQIGAANIAPALNSVSSLGNQATQAMQKLAPSIGPAMQGLTSLAGAVLGAFGDSGPAVTSFANTVTQNAGAIQKTIGSVVNAASDVSNFAVNTLGGMERFDQVGADASNSTNPLITGTIGVMRGNEAAGRKPMDSGGPDHTATPVSRAGVGPVPTPTPGAAPRAAATAPGVASGGFDPSKPFSGMLPDGQGGFTVGPGEDAKPAASKPTRMPAGDFGKAFGLGPPPLGNVGSPDAAQYAGMTGAQIYEQQFQKSAGGPSTGPRYNGLGPRGPGQSVGGMPASIASGLGMDGSAALGSLMTGGMQSHVATSGGDTGAAIVKHVKKAVDTAGPAAEAGGAAVGGAIGSGMAAGTSSSMTVTDTVIRKHAKHFIDVAAGELGVHSPSEEFDYLGRMSMLGYARGFGAEDSGTFGALSAAHAQASRFSPDYAGGATAPTTISIRRKSQDPSDPNQDPSNPLLSTSSTSMMPPVNHYGPQGMSNIQAHNDRAADLARGRADLHAKAMANLGAVNPATGQKWVDPFKDPNNAMNNSNPLAGTPNDPQAKKQSLGQKAGNLWQQLNQIGPQDGLPGLKKLWNTAGQSSVEGLSQGMTAHIPKIQAAGASLSVAGVHGYKRKDDQQSPSVVWAGVGMNSAAGLAGGITAGTGGVVGAVGGMADAAQAAGQRLSDRGLMVGYAWATNVVTGASGEIKKADYQALGLPKLNQAAMTALAGTQLLSAGSGAESYKTPGNYPGLVTLAPASGSGQQSITVNHNINIDGQMHSVATQVFMNHLGQITDAIPLQQAA